MKDIVDYEEYMSCLEHLYSDTDYGLYATPSSSHAHNLRPHLEKILGDVSEASLLDVGCGRGDLLEFYEYSGWTVAGAEIVTSLLTIELANFEEIYPYGIADLHRIGDNLFDFVFFVNVLDHVWSANDILEGIQQGKRISKNGIVVICEGEPNFQTIEFPAWQWESLFSEFSTVDVFKHETGFIRVIALKEE